jgi:hypothetical protein
VRSVLVASLFALAAVLSPLADRARAATPGSAGTPGSIVAWGWDQHGQVSATPTGTGFTAVAAGHLHSVAVRADGSLVSWGYDLHGQVSATPTGTGFTAVTAGLYHSVALRTDGSLISWGGDFDGQISGTPTGTGFTAVAAGSLHNVALRADGSLLSWGDNQYEKVSGTPAGTGFTAVSAGAGNSAAVRADGSLVSWGSDSWGQASATPAGTGFLAVAVGNGHSVALRGDGSLVTWGEDSRGQVSTTPAGTGFTAVAAGGLHSTALRADGSMVSWGSDIVGQVSMTPTGTGFAAVAAGSAHSLALRPPIAAPDSVPPVITTSGATEMNADGTSGGAIVTYEASATDDDPLHPNAAVTCTPPSGSTFPIGVTTVTCTSTDASGNTATTSFPVTVVDVVAPVVSVPPPITVDPVDSSGAVVTFGPTATDDDSQNPNPDVTCVPPSGSTFPVGVTTVTCQATDGSGNTGTSTFTVTVGNPCSLFTELITRSTGTGPGKDLQSKAEHARDACEAGQIEKSCKILDDYIRQVEVHSPKQVSSIIAADLIAEANRIKAAMGC